MEGQLYDSKQVESVVNLPTKKELITKIAYSLKALPTKIARGIKGVPNKLGRAIVEIKKQKEEEEKSKSA